MPDVLVATSRGHMHCYLAVPSKEAPFPGVIVLHDVGGMSQDHRNQADWLAGDFVKNGYDIKRLIECDAEQIVVLRASNEQGVIVSRGSIDDQETRESACALLEGSREAFQRRARIYGISPA